MTVRRVMIAIRDEESADMALAWYRKFEMKSNDEVLLVHVVKPKLYLHTESLEHGNEDDIIQPMRRNRPYSEGIFKAPTIKQRTYSEGANKVSRQLSQSIANAGIQSSTIMLVDTSPGKALIRVAEENQVNFIVIGSSTHKLMGFWGKGVNNYVVKNATVPVGVVGAERKSNRQESILANPMIAI